MSLCATEYWVRDISQAAAVSFIERNHYAMGAPNTAVARHALVHFDSPEQVEGVALWLPPTRRAAESVSPKAPEGVLALSRLCLSPDVPKNGASFLLGRSMRLLDRERWPVLLTYADTRQGHTGAIYRATNWECLGEVPGSDAWMAQDGSMRGRKRGGRNLSAAEMRKAGYVRLPSMPKIKFVHRKGAT